PANAFPPPLAPLHSLCLLGPVPARSTHRPIVPPAIPCSIPRRISAALAPIAIRPPSHKRLFALLFRVASKLYPSPSALRPGGTARSALTTPIPPRSIPQAAPGFAKTSAPPSVASLLVAPFRFHATSPQPA